MKWIVAALLMVPNLALATCPPLPERSARYDALLGLVARAETEAQAAEHNNALWAIWTTAPDEVAQQILDRGMARRNSYNFLGAIEDFDALIAYCPHYAEGYNQRAFVHFLREDFDAALVDLNRALAITPDHIGAASGVALSLLQMGRETEGQLALRHALTLNPWLPERHQLREMPEIEETTPAREL